MDAMNRVILIRNPDHFSANLRELFRSGDQFTFHNAAFDCSFLLWNLNTYPRNVLCTKAAYKYYYPEEKSSSLPNVVGKLLRIELPKDHAITVGDWNSKFLSKEQITYAVGDVYFLAGLTSQLTPEPASWGISALSVSLAIAKLTGTEYTLTYEGKYNRRLRNLWLDRQKYLRNL
jgi:ribonuclease D